MVYNKENKTILLKFKTLVVCFLLVTGGIVQPYKCTPPQMDTLRAFIGIGILNEIF